MLIQRAALVAATSTLVAASAQAHFVWIHVDPVRQELQLQFGDPGTPDFGTLHYLEKARVWTTRDTQLELDYTATSVTAALSGTQFVGSAEMTFGLFGRDEKFLLEYHAKGRANLAGGMITTGLGVEILAERKGESILFTVLNSGVPAPGATLTLMDKGANGGEDFETDPSGQVTIDAPPTGPVYMRALVQEERSGDFEGEVFDTVKHYSTLTLKSVSDSVAHPLKVGSTAAELTAMMPRAVTSFGAVESGGFAYTLGGYFGRPHDYRREFQSTAFRRMNLTDGTWEELPSVGPIQGPALVAHAGSVYRVGGMRALDVDDERQQLESIVDFARFDPIEREWQAMPEMPIGRSSHMAAVIGDDLYVVGGWAMFAETERDDIWLNNMLRFDLANPNGAWESIDAPFSRRALGVAAAGDRLYVIGGISSEGDISKAVDIFDPATGIWSTGPEYPTGAFALSAVGQGARVFASASNGELVSLAQDDDQWIPVTTWNFPRMFHQLIASEAGQVMVLGGITSGGRVRHIETASLSAHVPQERSTHWQVPVPGTALQGQTCFLSGNDLHVIGGRLGRRTDTLEESFKLSLIDMSWSAIESAPITAPTLALATSGNAGMLIGKTDQASVQPAAFTLKSRDDEWQAAGFHLPAHIEGYALASSGDDLWLFGGTRVAVDASKQALRTIYTHKPGASDFELTEATMPRDRSSFNVAIHGGLAYLIGGVNGAGEPVNECDVLNLEDNTWSTIAAPGLEHSESKLVALNGQLILAGGSEAIESFDIQSGVWRQLETEIDLAGQSFDIFNLRGRLLIYNPDKTAPVVNIWLLDTGK